MRPRILLLDEPFSALDPARRAKTRREVRAIHREWQLTVLQVTHDFAEAGMLGDVAILLDRGRVLQAGAPDEVFRRPASPYIAEFLGAENVLAGEARLLDEPPLELDGAATGADDAEHHAVEFRTGPLTLYAIGPEPVTGRSYAVIRAEEVVISRAPHPSSARNLFRGHVQEITRLGAYARVTVDVDGVPLVAALTTRSVHELGLTEGSEVFATFKAMAVHLC
jgi:molybdopterin-binding protein